MFTVYIHTLTGENFNLDVHKNDTITFTKQQIEKLTDISTEQQTLVFFGKILENERTIDEYGIYPGSELLF